MNRNIRISNMLPERSPQYRYIMRFVGITKSYYDGGEVLRVLNGINLNIVQGSVTGIVGPSGCGKSTLMNIMGAAEQPDSGRIYYKDKTLDYADTNTTVMFRRYEVGWVFQEHNLFTRQKVLSNVMFPLELCGVRSSLAKKAALQTLDDVGLYDLRRKNVSVLSGGEKQRVAIARAIACGAEIILADEPTGSLDPENSERVMSLLKKINRLYKTTVVLITHNERLSKKYCDFIIDLEYAKAHLQQAFHGVRPGRQDVGERILMQKP